MKQRLAEIEDLQFRFLLLLYFPAAISSVDDFQYLFQNGLVNNFAAIVVIRSQQYVQLVQLITIVIVIVVNLFLYVLL